WYRNGSPLSGANSPQLAFSNAQPGDAGVISVSVSNLAGIVSSPSVVFDVMPFSPTVVVPPTSQVLFVGTNCALSVEATGVNPLDYQWFFNDAPISGARSPILPLVAVDGKAQGEYKFLVANHFGVETIVNAFV